MHSIETEFIKNFIKPHRQERWLRCLASTNKRSAFLDCLNHCRDFEDQHVRIIRSASQLEEALHRVGGEDKCYILSSDPKLDGYWVKLDTALVDGTVGEFYELLKHCCGSMTDCLVFSTKSEIAYQ